MITGRINQKGVVWSLWSSASLQLASNEAISSKTLWFIERLSELGIGNHCNG